MRQQALDESAWYTSPPNFLPLYQLQGKRLITSCLLGFSLFNLPRQMAAPGTVLFQDSKWSCHSPTEKKEPNHCSHLSPLPWALNGSYPENQPQRTLTYTTRPFLNYLRQPTWFFFHRTRPTRPLCGCSGRFVCLSSKLLEWMCYRCE